MSPSDDHLSTPPPFAIASVDTAAAPDAVRQALTLTDDDAIQIMTGAAASHPDLETVVLATCNRTEIIVGAAADAAKPVTARRAIEVLHQGIAAVRPDHAPCLQAGANPSVYVGVDAVEHLFRVACGLESQLLGEAEILGQLRRAWHRAEALGSAGAHLQPLFRDAFAVGKRVRSTTEIGIGGAGLGSAVSAAVGDRSGPVVVIGAGQAGRTIARRLAKSGRPVTVANRSVGSAAELAREIGGEHVELGDTDEIEQALSDASVIVGAVSGEQPVVTGSIIGSIRAGNAEWHPLLIDVASKPTFATGAGLDVLTLDHLTDRESDLAERRHRAIPDAERTVKVTVDRHLARHAQRRDRLARHHTSRVLGNHQPVTAHAGTNTEPGL